MGTDVQTSAPPSLEIASKDVSIEGVAKRFGETVALKHIDMHVPAGTLATLLGPSGCGKTTLLRIIGGFETADTGSISFGGKDIGGVPVWDRRIGFVFQAYALWPHMNAFRNVAYGLKLQKISKDEIRRRVNEALAIVGLAGREDSLPGELSGGQQQRVALARALVLQPDVLLMDEPLSNLDAKLRVEMRQEILRIQRATGITAIYVTHDQEEALEMSDEIAVMREGVIEQLGSPQEIYGAPETTYVASFIGTINLMRGTSDGAGDMVTESGFRIRLPEAGPPAGERVVLAVRPEDIALVQGSQPRGPRDVTGALVKTTYLGRHRVSVIDVPGAGQVIFEHREALQPDVDEVTVRLLNSKVIRHDTTDA